MLQKTTRTGRMHTRLQFAMLPELWMCFRAFRIQVQASVVEAYRAWQSLDVSRSLVFRCL